MKCFVSPDLGGIDTLVIEERPRPGPLGPGQIRVAMKAASLNFRDLLVLSGQLRAVTLPSLIALADGAGEVTEVGAGVWRIKPGDRVALTYTPDWIAGEWMLTPAAAGRGGSIDGVMCEEMVVGEHEAVVLPSHLSFAEGACLPCAGVTAWHALCGAAPLLPGMTVLTQGAGGVSIFAMQFAKLFGARVIMTSSSPERCQRLRDLGADEVIDYNANPDWHLAVRDLTGGMGVDLCVEIGGAATVDKAIASTRIGGRIAIVGRLTGTSNTGEAINNGGFDMHSIKVGSRADFEAMNRAIAFHGLRPVIDWTYPFEELPEALRHLQSGKHFGKIAISIG